MFNTLKMINKYSVCLRLMMVFKENVNKQTNNVNDNLKAVTTCLCSPRITVRYNVILVSSRFGFKSWILVLIPSAYLLLLYHSIMIEVFLAM